MRKIIVDTDKAKSLYESGMTLVQVAAELDASRATIHARLSGAGVRFRKGGGRGKVPEKQTQTTRICSCCKIRPVPSTPVNGVKLTRLCAECYHASSSEAKYSLPYAGLC